MLGKYLLTATLAMSLGVAPALAGKRNSERSPGNLDTSFSALIDKVVQAHDLAEWAEANKNAVAYALAASILSGAGSKGSQIKLRGDVVTPPEGTLKPPLTVEGMAKRAQELVAGNEQTQKAVDAILGSIQPDKGSLEGPGCYDGYVSGDDDVLFDEAFEGDRPAYVSLKAWSSDVDLWVYDEDGNEICRSTGFGAKERCDWVPIWTGTFSLRVENLHHPNGTNFVLCTN